MCFVAHIVLVLNANILVEKSHLSRERTSGQGRFRVRSDKSDGRKIILLLSRHWHLLSKY